MEDACDELLLVDGDENIPFLWGRCLCGTNTNMLNEAKTRFQSEIKDLESKCAAFLNIMNATKTQFMLNLEITSIWKLKMIKGCRSSTGKILKLRNVTTILTYIFIKF